MLPSDAKSQNSDYGSFCHTPSDTFGNQTTTGSGGGNGAGSPDHLDHGQGNLLRGIFNWSGAAWADHIG